MPIPAKLAPTMTILWTAIYVIVFLLNDEEMGSQAWLQMVLQGEKSDGRDWIFIIHSY